MVSKVGIEEKYTVIRVDKDQVEEVINALSNRNVAKVEQTQRVLLRVEGEISADDIPKCAKVLDQNYSWLDWKLV